MDKIGRKSLMGIVECISRSAIHQVLIKPTTLLYINAGRSFFREI